MRKKVLAVILTVAMCAMMSTTVFAASSSSSSSSSSKSSGSTSGGTGGKQTVTEATKGNVNTDSVSVATVGADGSVSKVKLTQYTQQVNNTVTSVAAGGAANGMTPGDAVSSVLSSPASDVFKNTINVLGGNIRLVNAGGYKPAALAADEATGKTIASVGAVKGVTKYAIVLLTAVNADGTTEIVEGTVDPVSLQVIGVFSGNPAVITVSVIMPA